MPTDAKMLGIETTQLRPRMENAIDVILRLLDGQSVTARTDWYVLDDARLQLRPYGDLSVSVVATISPSGPKLAGRAELVEFINRTGRGAFGTPEMAAQQIQRLIDRTGGFGTYLFQGADFADWRDTLRSYELFAEEVIPLFNGTLGAVQASYDMVMGRTEANRSAITAARAAAEAQWQRERRDIGTS